LRCCGTRPDCPAREDEAERSVALGQLAIQLEDLQLVKMFSPKAISVRPGFAAGHGQKRSRRERWTNTIVCTAVCGFCAWYIATVSVAAQSPSQPPGATAPASSRTIWSNVYSASQAKRGEAGANRLCTKCHAPDFTGGQDGPSLVGAEVLGSWASLTLGDLLDRIKTTMPADAPRSLGQQETVDILAYMLSLNKCAAGDEELPPDMEVLSQIRVTSQPERK
jgi:cbb3-type cytochrome c oxidase subunit III